MEANRAVVCGNSRELDPDVIFDRVATRGGKHGARRRCTTTEATSGVAPCPLLVLDMWEHAYYLQYQNVKGEWVKAFWKIVNWEDVRQRLQKVRTLDLGL